MLLYKKIQSTKIQTFSVWRHARGCKREKTHLKPSKKAKQTEKKTHKTPKLIGSPKLKSSGIGLASGVKHIIRSWNIFALTSANLASALIFMCQQDGVNGSLFPILRGFSCKGKQVSLFQNSQSDISLHLFGCGWAKCPSWNEPLGVVNALFSVVRPGLYPPSLELGMGSCAGTQ